MQNHFRINVSLGGRHFFATDVRDREDAHKVFAVLLAKFPESDGYKISVTRWEGVGIAELWG